MCWHNYITGARCFIWSARRCPEACCCVLSLGIQFFGLIQSSSKLVRVFFGLLQFFSSRVRVFSGRNKVYRGACVFLSRDTTKSLAVRSCFSSGLLQSNSLCVRTFFSGFYKISRGAYVLPLSGCCKLFRRAVLPQVSRCACTLFFRAVANVCRYVGVLLTGLLQSVFFRAMQSSLLRVRAFPRASAKFIDVYVRLSRAAAKSLVVCVCFFSRTVGC